MENTKKDGPTQMVLTIPIHDIPQGKFYGGVKSMNIDHGTETRPLYERSGDSIKFVKLVMFKNGKCIKSDSPPEHIIIDDAFGFFGMKFENGRYGIMQKHTDDCLDAVWFKVAQLPRGTDIVVQ